MSNALHITADPPLVGNEFREVDAMRAVRRRRRLGDVAWGDLAYRVYTTALGTIVLVIFASGLIGDDPLNGRAVDRLGEYGPGWAGLVASVILVIGARSGWRGGPVALEQADVHNLLLGPVPRWRVLLRPAIGTVGYGSAALAAAGALTGLLLAQRAPGGNAGFTTSGILFGLVTGALAYGTAMITASRRVDGRVLVLLASLLAVASLLRVTGRITWAPLDVVGSILFWPIRFTPAGVVAFVIGAALVVIGLRSLEGISIELAQRRTQLVGQLRFAVTQQDLRSVMLLRRQLASEHPVGHNRLRFITGPLGPRFPVAARSLASIGRWPLIRIGRVVLLGAVAAIASRGVWHGTTPLVLVAGLCTYIAALDVLEPLAQEVDHPTMVESYPEQRGVLFLRHLAPATFVMIVGLLPGAVLGLLVERDPTEAVGILLITVTAAVAGTASGSVSMVGEAILSATDQAMMPPEVAGPRVVMKTLWPPFVAMTGFAPLLGAALTTGTDVPVGKGLMIGALPPLVLGGMVALWVYYRDEIHQTMNEAMGR